MTSLDEAVVARLDAGGRRFEVLIDPHAAQAYREGETIDWEEALATDEIWSDAAKGKRAAEEALNDEFDTVDPLAVCRAILDHGHLQLTTDQRREMVARRRRQIIDYIAANAINPQSGLPHPPQRIKNALEEFQLNVDPFEGVEPQAQRALKELRKLLPISFALMRVAVKIPAIHVGRSYGSIKEAGKLMQEEYQQDGSWVGVLELPAGAHATLLDRLGSLTHGTAETKILK